jgi:peroxiredoxin
MTMLRLVGLLSVTLLAGCTSSVSIPTGSGSVGYEQATFLDDAPSQTTPAEFPQSFVDADGKPVELQKFHGRKVVLVVLRGVPQTTNGAFCPSCLAQVGGLMANQSQFESRGVEVLVLFPGPSDRVGEFVELARRETANEPLSAFRLLLDRDLSTCRQLGIQADLAKPSTYVLDSNGRVCYAYVGETSTDRPSVKAVLAQLDRVK